MKRLITLSAIAAMSSALFVHAAALACDSEDAKGDKLSRMDGNSDGKVTQAELVSAWSARFDATDTNKDGTVSDTERTAAHTAHMAERVTAMDANKNGNIEQSEAKGPLAHFFTAIDTDKNGSISKAELAAHRAAFEKDHPRPDHGKHAPSTKAELTAKATEHFKRLDKNGDGVLSGDELTAHHGRRGGHHGHHDGDDA